MDKEGKFGWYTEAGEFNPITTITGGWCVKRLPEKDGTPRCIHVMEMAFNFRIVRSIGECDHTFSSYDRGWCYVGKVKEVFTMAILQAVTWDGEDNTCPYRWNKNAMTKEWYDSPGYLGEEECSTRPCA